ncbi:MAG: prepilin-type N-terminal cleavage/methylation domain-containing protein [Pedosphaera sp.]|nr:prepilin-type N-terminal cleavage/methylation domain-containing protein [Pedosphaera sp.]
MKTKTSRQSGFTFVEIMIVVAIIGLLASSAIPSFIKAQNTAKRQTCLANLCAIEGVKTTWALEQKIGTSTAPSDTDLFGPANYIREKPLCPASGSYDLKAVDARPTCTVPDHTF